MGKIFLKILGKDLLIEDDSVRAGICAAHISYAAYPTVIAFIAGTAERITTFFTFYERTEKVFAALAFVVVCKSVFSFFEGLLCFIEKLIAYDSEFGTFCDEPFILIFLYTLACEKVLDLLFAVDDFANIDAVDEDP